MSSLGRLVAATDVFPMRAVYAGIYRSGIEALRALLRPLKGLKGVYLTGSYVRGEHIHGRSDVDFFVVVDPSYEPGPLKSALERATTLFPFLGPVSERMRQIVVLEGGQVNNPYLLYRQRAGLTRTLLEAPGFRLDGPHPNGVLWVAEACLQIRLAVEGVRAGRDDLYFWRTRLRALHEVLQVAGGQFQLPALVLQNPQQLMGKTAGQEKCLQAMIALLNQLDGHVGQLGLIPPNMPNWQNYPRLERVTHQTLRAPGPWTARLGGFQVCLADPRWAPFHQEGSLFSWQPLSLVGFGEPLLVTSRLQRKGGPLWSWTLEEARRTLHFLPHQLEDRRLKESDWGLIQALLAIVTLQALPNVLSKAEAIVHLAQRHPEHQPFLTELVTYLRALEEGQGLAASRSLSPNFFGYLQNVAGQLLKLPRTDEPLDKRLTLSLCVVTRDRREWLHAMLETVRAQTRQPDEIVIVDNSPSPHPIPNTPNVHQPRGKLGALRNRAIQESTGEIVAFTDDDCLLDPHWLAHVERSFLRDRRIGAVGGRVRHLRERETAVDRFHRAYLG